MASSFSFSSFFSFLPFRQNSAAKINTTQQPAPSFSRIMASGRCTAVVTVGTYNVSCPCPRGEFEAHLLTLDTVCKKCAHPLSQHEDASSTLPQHEDASSTRAPGSFILPQGMASLVSSLDFSHVFRSS